MCLVHTYIKIDKCYDRSSSRRAVPPYLWPSSLMALQHWIKVLYGNQCYRSGKLQAIWGKTEEREATFTCRRKNKKQLSQHSNASSCYCFVPSFRSTNKPTTMVYGVIRNLQASLKYRGGWKGLFEHMYTVSY